MTEKTFADYYREAQENPPAPEYGGGYVIPEYIWTKAPGIRARLWRWAGWKFKRDDWYQRGLYQYPLAAKMREYIKLAKELEE